jgi:hypothetical protein
MVSIPIVGKKNGLLLIVVCSLLSGGCLSPAWAWRHVSTAGMSCSPFEVVIVRGVQYEVRRIQGSVAMNAHGKTGEAVPGVLVALRELGGTALLAEVATDDEGRFAFGDVPEGWYQLDTCRPGLNSVVVPVHVSRRASERSVGLVVSVAN